MQAWDIEMPGHRSLDEEQSCKNNREAEKGEIELHGCNFSKISLG